MAVRTFLKLREDGDIQQMSTAEMDALKKLAVKKYAEDPTAEIQQVITGGNLGTFINSILIPGNVANSNRRFNSEANTPDVVETTNNFSRLNYVTQNQAAPVDNSNIEFPVYLDGSNNIIACTLQDMIDTIWGPAADLIYSSSEDETLVGGTYALYKSGQQPNNTSLVGSGNIFTDTVNTADYSVNESVPYSTTPTTETANIWNLYRFNTPDEPEVSPGVPLVYPLKITQGGDALRPFTGPELESLWDVGIRYTTRNVSGYVLSYNINGAGIQKGQAIEDTRRTASRYIQDQDGDNYYTQEVPTGSYTAVRTYRLRLNKS